LDYYASSGVPDSALVSVLWMNLVGTSIAQPDLDNLVNQLQTGGFTQAELFAAAAEHPLNQEHIGPLIAVGILYQAVYFDWNSDSWESFGV
jgi:hypothetical protein